MSAALRAGIAYTLVVFALAFLLGVVRVLFVAPRIGELAAVALEVPITLTASWAVAPRLVRAFGVRPGRRERAAMGAAAFALLMALEWALALLVFGRSVAETLATYGTAAGVLGLAGQVGFALVPLLQAGGAPGRVTATRRIGRL